MNLHMVEKFIDIPTPKASVTTERSPAGRCYLTQQQLIIPDINSEARFDRDIIELLKSFGVKS